jgi:hypothetical protein
MRTSEESYYLKFGPRRVRMMRFIQKESGEQIVVLELHSGGFHLTKHPFGANPHMVNRKTGLRRELDITALRAHDWNADLPQVQQAFDALFYWPVHRADLLAIPGPPGTTWVQRLLEVCKGPDFDVVELVQLVLGYGTIYRVGYRQRAAFFATDLGKGCLIWDKKERRVGFWTGRPFPDRPLFGLRAEDKPFFKLMPPTAQRWSTALDYEIEVGAEEFFESRDEMFEDLLQGVAPELEELVRGLRIIRWEARRVGRRGLRIGEILRDG